MNCPICGKAITLVPSAEERSRKTGIPASHFRALFTEHDECVIKKRNEDTVALMRKIKETNHG